MRSSLASVFSITLCIYYANIIFIDSYMFSFSFSFFVSDLSSSQLGKRAAKTSTGLFFFVSSSSTLLDSRNASNQKGEKNERKASETHFMCTLNFSCFFFSFNPEKKKFSCARRELTQCWLRGGTNTRSLFRNHNADFVGFFVLDISAARTLAQFSPSTPQNVIKRGFEGLRRSVGRGSSARRRLHVACQ